MVAVTNDPDTTQAAPIIVTNPMGSATTPAKGTDCTKNTVISGVIQWVLQRHQRKELTAQKIQLLVVSSQ